MRRLARRARVAGAQPFDQLQAAGAIQAGETQGGVGQRLRGQQRFGFQQDAAIEALRRGGGVFGDPVAMMLAIHRAGGDEHDAFDAGRVERVQRVFQAVDEDAAVGRGIARAGGGDVDDTGDAGRQGGQAVGPGDVALQPADAAGVAGGRMAAQRVDLVAAGQEKARGALAEIAAADEEHPFSHCPRACYMPL